MYLQLWSRASITLWCIQNKGTSQRHKITFLSKWFHKDILTWRPFCFTKGFVMKEGSSDYKKVRKRCSLKNLWQNGSSWNQKWFFYGITWRTFICKSVCLLACILVAPMTINAYFQRVCQWMCALRGLWQDVLNVSFIQTLTLYNLEDFSTLLI